MRRVPADESVKDGGLLSQRRKSVPSGDDPWRQIWALAQSSAEKRLGRTLLRAYFLLAVLGFVVVAIWLFIDRVG